MPGRWWIVLGPNKRRAASLIVILLLTASWYSDVTAQGICSGATGSGPGPIRRAESRVGTWDMQVVAEYDCRRGVRAAMTARQDVPGDLFRSGSADRPRPSNAVVSVPIYCRRDDYMFLP